MTENSLVLKSKHRQKKKWEGWSNSNKLIKT